MSSPARIPPLRATIAPRAVRSGATIDSLVRSPPRPISSSNAARTTGSAISSSDAAKSRKGTLGEGFITLRVVAPVVAPAALAARQGGLCDKLPDDEEITQRTGPAAVCRLKLADARECLLQAGFIAHQPDVRVHQIAQVAECLCRRRFRMLVRRAAMPNRM